MPFALTLLLLLLVACTNPEVQADAGAVPDDAGVDDAGVADAGPMEQPGDAGPVEDEPDAGDAGPTELQLFGLDSERRLDAIPVPVDTTTAPACTAMQPSGCLYRPPMASTVTEWIFADDVSYVDVLGLVRRVPIAVYRARATPPNAPVVVMSHGGSSGIEDPTRALREWAAPVAAAGYVVVSIAHTDYPMTAPGGATSLYQQLCDAVGVPQVPGFMCALKVSWQRPLDIDAVVQWLEARAASNPAWASAMDLSRLAHFGHSAGASAAMMVGGVTRNFRCAQPFGANQGTLVPCAVADLVSRRVAKVRAVVGFSPQGPGTEGFMTESYGTLEVPMLMATGREDGDPGEPDNRLLLFPLLPAGPRWLLYLDDVGAQHGLFGGNLDPCVARASAQRCADLRGTLSATLLAFLDAHLKQRAQALTWLGAGGVGASVPGAALTPR